MAFPQNVDGLGIRFSQDVAVCVRAKASTRNDPSNRQEVGRVGETACQHILDVDTRKVKGQSYLVQEIGQWCASSKQR